MSLFSSLPTSLSMQRRRKRRYSSSFLQHATQRQPNPQQQQQQCCKEEEEEEEERHPNANRAYYRHTILSTSIHNTTRISKHTRMSLSTLFSLLLLCTTRVTVATAAQHHNGYPTSSTRRRSLSSSSPPFESLPPISLATKATTTTTKENENVNHHRNILQDLNDFNSIIIPTHTSRSSVITTSSLGNFSFTLFSTTTTNSPSQNNSPSSLFDDEQVRSELTRGTRDYLEDILMESDFASDGNGAFDSIQLTLVNVEERAVVVATEGRGFGGNDGIRRLHWNTKEEEEDLSNRRQLRQRHHLPPTSPRNTDSTAENPIEIILTFSAIAKFTQPFDPSITNGDELLSFISQTIQQEAEEETDVPPSIGVGIEEGGGGESNSGGSGGYVQRMKERFQNLENGTNEQGAANDDDDVVRFWDNVSSISVEKKMVQEESGGAGNNNDNEDDTKPPANNGDLLSPVVEGAQVVEPELPPDVPISTESDGESDNDETVVVVIVSNNETIANTTATGAQKNETIANATTSSTDQDDGEEIASTNAPSQSAMPTSSPVPTSSPISFVLSNQTATDNDSDTNNDTIINPIIDGSSSDDDDTNGTKKNDTNKDVGAPQPPDDDDDNDEGKSQRKQTAAVALGVSAGVVAIILLITSYFYRRWERNNANEIEYTGEGEALTLDHPPAPSPPSSPASSTADGGGDPPLIQRQASAASSSTGAASNDLDTMMAGGVKESTFASYHQETDAEGRRLKSRSHDGEEDDTKRWSQVIKLPPSSSSQQPPPEWLSSQTPSSTSPWWDSTKKNQDEAENQKRKKGLSKSLALPTKRPLLTNENRTISFTGTAASRRRIRQEEDDFLHNSATAGATTTDSKAIALLLQDSERSNLNKSSSSSTGSSGKKKAGPFGSWRSASKSSMSSSSSSFDGKKALLRQNRDGDGGGGGGEGRNNSLTQRLRSFLGSKSAEKDADASSSPPTLTVPLGESNTRENDNFVSNVSRKDVTRLEPIEEGMRESMVSVDAAGLPAAPLITKLDDSSTQDNRSDLDSQEKDWHCALTSLPYKFDPNDESVSSGRSNLSCSDGTKDAQQRENDGIWRIKPNDDGGSTKDHLEDKESASSSYHRSSDASLSSHHDAFGGRRSHSAKSESGAGSLSHSDHTGRLSLPRLVGEEPAAAAAAAKAASLALPVAPPGHASVGSSRTRKSRRSRTSLSSSSRSTRLNELQSSLDDMYCDLSAKTKQTDTQKEVVLAADRKAQREKEEQLLYEHSNSVLRRTSIMDGSDENAEMVTILDDPNEEEMEDEAMKMMMLARTRGMENADDDKSIDRRSNNLSHVIP